MRKLKEEEEEEKTKSPGMSFIKQFLVLNLENEKVDAWYINFASRYKADLFVSKVIKP